MLTLAKNFFALVFTVRLCAGVAIQDRSFYAVKDSHPVPNKWQRIGPAPIDHILDLQVGLRQGRFEELERRLYEGI